MTRRATKKMLRRAELAFSQERFHDAERTYRDMISRFQDSAPSLLDQAACLIGLIRTLYAMNRDSDAVVVAESAGDILCVPVERIEERMEVAA